MKSKETVRNGFQTVCRKEMHMIRYAVIGAGQRARQFPDQAALCGGLGLTMIFTGQEGNASTLAAGQASSLRELELSPDVDGVYIAGEDCLQFEYAFCMLSAGKHVLCGQPGALTAEELGILIETAEQRHVSFMASLPSLAHPGFLTLQENIRRVGSVRHVRLSCCRPSPAHAHKALMDQGMCCICPLASLFGMPDTITAEPILPEDSMEKDGAGGGLEASGIILARYRDMDAAILYSGVSGNRLPGKIQGDEGSLVIKDICNPREILFCGRSGSKERLDAGDAHSPLLFEINEWVSQMLGKKDWRPHMQDFLMSLQMMEAIRQQAS